METELDFLYRCVYIVYETYRSIASCKKCTHEILYMYDKYRKY